ncbi:hypothetical protein TNCV_2136061 [Trichonephila clavipes]|nr:hypothetical protein TNCV_2136061 [Trichonephila clavipes]
MPLIEDLSRNGIEDCFYSPEAQKGNAYSTPIQQGMLRKNKILKRILQGKRVNRISSNPWRWNSRVKRLSRTPSAVSQLSRSLANF